MTPFVSAALDFIPLLLFFIANSTYGLFVGTFVLMVATPIVIGIQYYLKREVAFLPLITAVFVILFGALTLLLQDDTFIKMKPTLVNIFLASALLISTLLKKNLLHHVFGKKLSLPDSLWVKLTYAWIVFFIFLAGLNEFIWRTFSTDFWVRFKVFGTLPITMLFSFVVLAFIYPYLPKKPS